MLSGFKAVFFDAGGTLFYPYPSVGEIYQKVAAQYGCIARAEELEALFKQAWLRRDGLADLVSRSSEKNERDWWRALVHEVFSQTGGVARFENFFSELYGTFGAPEAWRIFPGAVDVLKALKARKKRLAIISNWDSRLFKLCKGLGLEDYFEFMLASAVFGVSKPSPRIFEEALRRVGVDPSVAVHIGDSYEDDIKGAHGAGIKGILIDRHHAVPRQFDQVTTIRDLKELIA